MAMKLEGRGPVGIALAGIALVASVTAFSLDASSDRAPIESAPRAVAEEVVDPADVPIFSCGADCTHQ